VDFLQLDQHISNCLKEGHFAEAEQALRSARAQASEEGDKYALEHILSSFVELYCLMQPPRPKEAESYCLELEQLTRTAYSKLRTAMMFYWCMHAPALRCEESLLLPSLRLARFVGEQFARLDVDEGADPEVKLGAVILGVNGAEIFLVEYQVPVTFHLDLSPLAFARISVGLPITNVAVIAVPLVLVECPPYHRGIRS
jgi:hypothetical protein